MIAPNGLIHAELFGKNVDQEETYHFSDIVHGQMATVIGNRQVFRVKLAGGLDRTVVVDADDPQRCESMYELNDHAFRSISFPQII